MFYNLLFNPLNPLNRTCHLLALLGAHHILHVSRIRVKQKVVAAPVFYHILFLIAFLEQALIRNIIIILCINYIIVICINNNNNTVINNNNNYGTPQYLILPFRIPMCTRKNLSRIYRHIGHGPSRSFASPGLV